MCKELNRSGLHLIVDGFGDSKGLRDAFAVEKILESVAKVAAMRILDLRVYEVDEDPSAVGEGPFRDPGGVTRGCAAARASAGPARGRRCRSPGRRRA